MDIDKNKALFQLTVGEFIEVMDYVLNKPQKEVKVVKEQKGNLPQYEYGIAGIARIFNCSISTANRIKASGRIDDAIRQQGRMIVIDTQLALEYYNDSKRLKSKKGYI